MLLAGMLLPFHAPLAAQTQQPRTAVAPDTATVGDIVRAAVRVELPAGYQVAFPDSLPLGKDMDNAARREVQEVPLAGGGRQVTAIYPVAVWRPGALALPAVPVRIVGGGQDRTLQATLPSIHVRSVLPADTAGIQPKPPHDVLGANRLLWPYILAAILAALLLAALLYWLWRRWRARRAAAAVEEVEALTAREQALRELDRLRELEWVERGMYKDFYSAASEAVRGYLARVDERWGTERTTSELVAALRTELDVATAAELARLLGAADLVKFARRVPTSDEALAEWAALRGWVAGFREPVTEAELVAAEAA